MEAAVLGSMLPHAEKRRGGVPGRSVLMIVGTRPEIIKMAPVYKALLDAGMRPYLLHTGQHVEMAYPLYELFGMVPDHILKLARRRGDLACLSAELLDEIAQHILALQPGVTLVHGDTTTALAGAMASFYAQVPVGHVEAGLRTNNLYDPFPEELNRTLIGRMATWHFAPTQRSRENLAAEGLVNGVYFTGNTAVDAARWGVAQLARDRHAGDFLQEAGLHLHQASRLLLVTAHRRENWGAGIEQIALAVKQWLIENERYAAVWPVHLNPVVADAVHGIFADSMERLAGRLLLCPPLDYMQLLALLSRCWLVLTDSGGIQEEAAALDRPVLVLRATTERPEIVESGRGILVGADAQRIRHHLGRLHADRRCYQGMLASPNPFGDGHSGERIASILCGVRSDIAQ